MGHRILGRRYFSTPAAPVAFLHFSRQDSTNRTASLPRSRAATNAPPTVVSSGASPSGRDCIVENEPSTRQKLCSSETSATASPSGCPDSPPNVTSDHGGDVLAVTSVAHSGQHPPLLAEQGDCLVASVVTMDDSSFTTKIKVPGGPAAVQLRCVALSDTGSPQTFINTHTLKSMSRVGAASAFCERHTPSRNGAGLASLRLSRTPRLQYA